MSRRLVTTQRTSEPRTVAGVTLRMRLCAPRRCPPVELAGERAKPFAELVKDLRISSRGRCAGPPWWRENGPGPDADVSVMPCELMYQQP